MTYVALYRKWRPQTFDEVVGQEHIVRTLKNALKSDKVSHAYLFCGPRGTGKTSLAKILAKAVNCTSTGSAKPCNVCPQCRSINAGDTMDVLEIDAASNRGIDEIRDLRERVKFAPAHGKYRVYIVDEVHMLTPEAFNALLKTLEEPPEHVIFILATTEAHKVPLTIVSRCQRLDFAPIPTEKIVRHLRRVAKDQNIQAEDSALVSIARYAQGSVRDALGLFDQTAVFGEGVVTADQVSNILGLAPIDTCEQMIEAMARQDAPALLRLIQRVVEEGKDLKLLVRDVLNLTRDILVTMIAGEDVSLENTLVPSIRRLGDGLSKTFILKALEVLSEIDKESRHAQNLRLLVEMGMVKLCLDQKEEVVQASTETIHAEARLDAEKLWKRLLDKVKAEKRPIIHARLRDARKVSLEDGVLTVLYPGEARFHLNEMKKPENTSYIEERLERLAGRKLKVEFALEPATNAEGDTASNPTRGPKGEPSLLERALSLFGGEILELDNDEEVL